MLWSPADGAGARPLVLLGHGGGQHKLAAGENVWPQVADQNTQIAERVVPEWRATLDALLGQVGLGGPVGYFGLSLSCGIGVPLAAAEPRISAAVLLAGRERLEVDSAERFFTRHPGLSWGHGFRGLAR